MDILFEEYQVWFAFIFEPYDLACFSRSMKTAAQARVPLSPQVAMAAKQCPCMVLTKIFLTQMVCPCVLFVTEHTPVFLLHIIVLQSTFCFVSCVHYYLFLSWHLQFRVMIWLICYHCLHHPWWSDPFVSFTDQCPSQVKNPNKNPWKYKSAAIFQTDSSSIKMHSFLYTDRTFPPFLI